ncbi:hypothetical protein R3P38DRAFT_3101376 [Favolaschia claudopus]|uniref:Uncharacterized protein n=1 Tax=Favolaschia claudopus TaxID=2862362 RepID=A0AAV9ZM54_9AGAR
MLSQKRGYPLFCPAPPDHHPNINSGIAIGDVGCIDEGEFDYLFNVFSSCPDGFNSLDMNDPNRLNTTSEVECHDIDPGSYFSSTVEVQHEKDDTLEYLFHCSGTCGAILALPRGAYQRRLKDGGSRLRGYVVENSRNWYQHVHTTLGRDIDNGKLFLVTGYEKARSWGMAHYSEHLGDQKFTLGFRDAPGSTGYAWSSAAAPSQVQWKKHVPEYGPSNQTIFLRGWTISLAPKVWREEFSGANSSTELVPPLSSRPPHLQAGMGLNPSSVVLETTKTCNPSVLMNAYISRRVPSATVVLSHTDDWTTLLEKDPEADPLSPTDLYENIATHFKVVSKDGAAFLEPNETSSTEREIVGPNDESSYKGLGAFLSEILLTERPA